MVAFHKWVPFTCRRSIADPQGCYLLFVLLIDMGVTICTYYAPNERQLPFLPHLSAVIQSHLNGTLLLCGDSNLVLNTKLDRSSPDPSQLTASLRHTMICWINMVLEGASSHSKRLYFLFPPTCKLFSHRPCVYPNTIPSLIVVEELRTKSAKYFTSNTGCWLLLYSVGSIQGCH